MNSVKLGLGLIGIGRKWGLTDIDVPKDDEVMELLQTSIDLGIRFFDTAPAYGLSEKRLGKFIKKLDKNLKKEVTISTKFGENWSTKTNSSHPDHTFASLKKSLDSSLKKLGHIDILQIHKTNPSLFKDKDVLFAIDYAKNLGIQKIGASIVDQESGKLACESKKIDIIQLPYNLHNQQFKDIIELATNNNKEIIINRPFDTGKIIYSQKNAQNILVNCFSLILFNKFNGYILTGTKNGSHLKENVYAFNKALNGLKTND